jgi:N-acetylglutamate synthase-like GNAT family acetyltransferase
MLTETKPQIMIPTAANIEEARLVAQWTKGAHTMLEKTPEQILKLFEKEWSILLVAAESRIPIAHAAITYVWPENWVEIGSLYVAEDQRGKDLGKKATLLVLEMAKDRYPGSKTVALCNRFSLPIFEKFGGVRMSYEELPPEVFSECETSCPNFRLAKSQGRICCDTPVNMTGALYNK